MKKAGLGKRNVNPFPGEKNTLTGARTHTEKNERKKKL